MSETEQAVGRSCRKCGEPMAVVSRHDGWKCPDCVQAETNARVAKHRAARKNAAELCRAHGLTGKLPRAVDPRERQARLSRLATAPRLAPPAPPVVAPGAGVVRSDAEAVTEVGPVPPVVQFDAAGALDRLRAQMEEAT